MTIDHTNRLINETSPYLLQHAHNPVDWFPWGDEALAKAREEGKMLIISIGYSACHWCHVMEHESFEDESVAEYMNAHFVSIKIDREERPDIDQIYMNAIQLLSGRGGWPLNVITKSDGRPIHGGTYFPKDQWLEMLKQLVGFAKSNPEKLEEHVHALTLGIKESELIRPAAISEEFTFEELTEILEPWSQNMDKLKGGNQGAPKFPMPVSYNFLLQYAHHSHNQELFRNVILTLDKMSDGGIYDQLRGGFSRYSVDADWRVPHFEKMLYDNAQLVSLYSKAYQKCKKERYKEVVVQTLEFVEEELLSPDKGFYSALDADSEGVEGKFYRWTKSEFTEILGSDAEMFIMYFGISAHGNWEQGYNVLERSRSEVDVAQEFGLSEAVFKDKLCHAKQTLLYERSKRQRPGLDNKVLASWNALMCKAYVDAYLVFNDPDYLSMSISNMDFILSNFKTSNYRLDRSYQAGKTSINAFLDDYAFVIDALIGLYQVTFQEKYLNEARGFMDYTLKEFYDVKSRMFFYSSASDPELIARKYEIADNVIPSSNSTMAHNLMVLGHFFSISDWVKHSKQMLSNVREDLPRAGAYYAHWCSLLMNMADEPFEVAIVGPDALAIKKEMAEHYLPNVLFCGTAKESDLMLLKNKFVPGETIIYVCKNKICKNPVKKTDEALAIIWSKDL